MTVPSRCQFKINFYILSIYITRLICFAPNQLYIHEVEKPEARHATLTTIVDYEKN